MSRPLALVTQRVVVDPHTGERRDALDQRWSAFLAACGLLAVPVPNDAMRACDLFEALAPAAIVLTGGNDLGCVGGDAPERDATEASLIDLGIRSGTPVIGVCRGAQMIGWHFGGTLRRVAGHVGAHVIQAGAASRTVNSFHNYALDTVPDELSVTARSADGVVEAFAGRHAAIIGVMWHPERVTPFDVQDIEMIQGFIKAAACAA